jgi:hypothetical protein
VNTQIKPSDSVINCPKRISSYLGMKVPLVILDGRCWEKDENKRRSFVVKAESVRSSLVAVCEGLV